MGQPKDKLHPMMFKLNMFGFLNTLHNDDSRVISLLIPFVSQSITHIVWHDMLIKAATSAKAQISPQ